jgi:hypothetical protein
MSVTEDKIEQERIARQAAINKALETETEPAGASVEATSADAQPSQPSFYPPLAAWERIEKGRRVQWRPVTTRELEAENDRLFMEAQRRQDKAHADKVQAAVEEAKREQKRLDQKREHERVTGRRPMQKDTCSLDEARRLGYLPSVNEASGKPEWWSEKNPTGQMCGG